MNNQTLYQVGRVAAVVVAVATAVITAATGLSDLGLTKQAVAILSLVVIGLQALAPFLPQANKPSGTVRGSPKS